MPALGATLKDKGYARSLVALIAAFALSLRLAWPAPPIPLGTAGPVDFGEHALCLAAIGDAPAPVNQAPAAPSDHDGGHCCLFHAVSGPAPLPPLLTERLAFADAAPLLPAAAPYRAPAYPPGTLPARPPPIVG